MRPIRALTITFYSLVLLCPNSIAQSSGGIWDGTTLTKPRPWESINIPPGFGAGSITNGVLGGELSGIPIPPYMPPVDERSSYTGKGPCDAVGGVATAGNPVIIATANKSENLPIFSTPGEKPLGINLRWNSKFDLRGHFGYNWLTDFDKRLYFVYENGEHCSVNPGGGSCGTSATSRHVQTFAFRPDGSKVRVWMWGASVNPNSMYQLGGNFQTGWTLRLDGEDMEYYSGSGVIQKEVDRNGISWTYNYSPTNATRLMSVTHTNGRTIGFNYVGTSPVLTSFSDTAGTQYTWGTTPTLDKLTYPGGDTVSFHYNVSGSKRLLGKSFNGSRYSTFSYNADGRPTATEHAGGVERTTFAYTTNPSGEISKVLVTNPLGRATTYHVNDKQLVTGVDGAATANCAADFSEMSYNINDRPDIAINNAGTTTDYNYNYYGQLLQAVEAVGTPLERTTINTWAPAPLNRLLASERPGLWRRTYAYTSTGRLSSTEEKNLSAHGIHNQILKTTYTYTLHGNGLVASQTRQGPKGLADRTVTNYSSRGEVTSIINGFGHTTTYSAFNDLGLPTNISGENGQITELTYDLRGRVLKERTYPNGSAASDTTYQYTAGLITRVTRPDGVSVNYFYDSARRLTGVYEINGSGKYPYTLYDYNVNSNVVQERSGIASSVPTTTTTEGLIHRIFTDYDEAGRVRQSRGNNGQFISFEYGPDGGVSKSTTTSGITSYVYDPLGRTVKRSLPGGTIEEFGYDANDNLIRFVDGKGGATAQVYDGLKQLWAESSPDSGTTTYAYGSGGLVSQMTRANNVVTTYGYDASGRQTSVSAGGETQIFSYDNCVGGKGRICRITDLNGELTFTYNPYGLLLTQGQKIGAASVNFGQSYAYDASGQLTGISYPGGIGVGYGFLHGRLQAVTATIGGAAHNVATNISVQPSGSISGWTYGNGLARNSTFDVDGRITGLSTRNGSSYIQNLTYQFTTTNAISKITNGVNPTLTQNYTYDTLSRLIAVTANGANQSFALDANSNRTSHTQGVQTNLYATASNSNRLTGISGSPATNYSYDANGNTISGDGATYGYSHFNRLVSTTRGNLVTNYWINPLGQRTRKDQGSTATSVSYIYGPSGQVEAEYNASANQWSHYLRLPTGEPVALVRNNQLYMIHTDHLGRPEAATNSTKAVVWKANNHAFDRAIILDNIGGLNLGFPGQYHDSETGLAYNHFRTYNPRTGRYLESDPIGLAGGSNSYAYVGGNPVNAVDPMGLLDVQARRFLGGEHRGQVRFTVTFYGPITGRLRDFKSILMSPMPSGLKTFDRALTYLDGDYAGVSSITAAKLSKRRMCDNYDDEAKKIFEDMFGAWSPTGTISADQLVRYIGAVNGSNPNLRYHADIMIMDATNGLPFE